MNWASPIVVTDFMVDGMNEATISRKLIKVGYMRLERYPRSEPEPIRRRNSIEDLHVDFRVQNIVTIMSLIHVFVKIKLTSKWS